MYFGFLPVEIFEHTTDNSQVTKKRGEFTEIAQYAEIFPIGQMLVSPDGGRVSNRIENLKRSKQSNIRATVYAAPTRSHLALIPREIGVNEREVGIPNTCVAGVTTPQHSVCR